MTAENLLLAMPLSLREERASGRPNRPMDEAKFDAFYRRNAGSLWSYLHRLTGDAAAADDLLQKTFINLLRVNPTFESDEHTRRWLYRTATNVTFDYFRELKRRGRSAGEVPAAPPADRDLRHDFKRVFTELNPRERALLWLAHVEESDHVEIGEALGIKAKSVRVLLFRARKRLADVLKRHGIGPEALR
jgi:RNA polymerase sigma-70 factor (ECF subfamily)